MSEFNNLISMLNDKNDIILSQQAKIDELQGRIDEALRHAVDHGGYDDLTHIIDILKGKEDEN